MRFIATSAITKPDWTSSARNRISPASAACRAATNAATSRGVSHESSASSRSSRAAPRSTRTLRCVSKTKRTGSAPFCRTVASTASPREVSMNSLASSTVVSCPIRLKRISMREEVRTRSPSFSTRSLERPQGFPASDSA